MGKTIRRRLTKAQKEWLQDYEDKTGFDPQIDDYHSGAMTFKEAAAHTLKWYHDHAEEVFQSLDNDLRNYL